MTPTTSNIESQIECPRNAHFACEIFCNALHPPPPLFCRTGGQGHSNTTFWDFTSQAAHSASWPPNICREQGTNASGDCCLCELVGFKFWYQEDLIIFVPKKSFCILVLVGQLEMLLTLFFRVSSSSFSSCWAGHFCSVSPDFL